MNSFDLSTHKNSPNSSSQLYGPLSFDRVNGGLPAASNFPIFRLLPIELYHRFTSHLSSEDLSAFALVDKDCLQLARSVQFCTIRYPPRLFTYHLAEEARDNVTRGIRVCVRHLVYGDDRYRYDRLSPLDILSTGSPYLAHVESSTSDRARALTILDIAMALPLSHFSLRLDECPEGLSSGPLVKAHWKLETFKLETHYMGSTRHETDLVTRLLPTLPAPLRTLIWNHSLADSTTLPVFLPNRFPQLRTLISSPQGIPATVYLGRNLHRLGMDLSDPLFLMHDLHIPSLRELLWLDSPCQSPSEATINFIRRHPQLNSFTIDLMLPTTFIESQLLPLLSDQFKSLHVLRLGSIESTISPSSLSMISRISSLRALWLTAGVQSGIPHQWKVDHAQLCSYLSQLSSLTHLVVTRDSYPTPSSHDSPWYYHVRMMPLDSDWRKYMRAVTTDPRQQSSTAIIKMSLAWELWHRDLMLEYAQPYFERSPSLTWCFFGQLPIRKGREGKAEIEANQRMDEELDMDLLRRMFGMTW